VPGPRHASPSRRSRLIWFAILLASVCFEGLGRRFLPQIPAFAYYFAKDACLLSGLWLFGLRPAVQNTLLRLFAPFHLILAALAGWALLQVANPEQPSVWLGIFGLRSYLLWWLAPLVVASALRTREDLDGAFVISACVVFAVSAFALFQFSQPADAQINDYTQGAGESSRASAIYATGRARVTSTFSYITGFGDFVGLMPALLLSWALGAATVVKRRLAFAAVGLAVAVAPTSGSRGAILVSLGGMLVVFLGAGFLASRGGRRSLLALVLSCALAFIVTPEGLEGLGERFRGDDTAGRLEDVLLAIPLYPLFVLDYPALGIGTGMQQNVRSSLQIGNKWETEGEIGRILIELGWPGYLLVTLCRIGLAVGLVRLARRARRGGHRGLAGGALAYALLGFISSLVFDHVSQALYFVNVGLLVASFGVEVEAAQRRVEPGVRLSRPRQLLA
jgi:hypothetical protein